MRRHSQYSTLRETLTDAIGRVTNSVRCVWSGGSPDSVYAPLVTRTEYPYGTEHYRVTTSPLGVQTVTRKSYGDNCGIEETASAGVTNRTTQVWGGATVEEEFTTDPISGEALSRATRTETSWDANGSEVVMVSVSRNGGAWATESVTRKDFLGRVITSDRAGYGGAMLITSNAYDTVGRLVYTLNPDGSAVAYAYDELGNSAGTVRVGAGQTLSFDPLGFSLADVLAQNTYAVEETPAWKEESDLGLSACGVPTAWWDCSAVVSHIPGQGAVTTSVTRVQLTGLSPACVTRTVSADIDGAISVTTESLDAANAGKTVTRLNVATAESETSVTVAGRAVSGTNALGAASAYTYDGFARQTATAQTAGGRTLQTVTAYHADGTVLHAAESCGAATNVTSYSVRQNLESPGGAYFVTVTDPLGNVTTNHYAGDGTLYRTGGAAYPTETAQDSDGYRSELRTWRDENGQPDVTRWHYDLASGLVTNKVYADGLGPSYAYLPDGRLSLRAWARGVETAYGYADTANGASKSASHSDGTPGVTNLYDLAGRLVSVGDGAGVRSFAYDARGRLTSETNALDISERQYSIAGRLFAFSQTLPGYGAGTLSVFYGYDEFGRVASVSSSVPEFVFGFSYLPGTAMVSGINNTAGSARTVAFEPNRNLITAVSNLWAESPVAVFAYGSDALGRRVSRNADTFGYNARSEVTGESSGPDLRAYAYDAVGNRVWSAENAVTNTYAANCLNQYTAITGGAPCYPSYDPDGNMLTNGVWSYAWDAENRMTGAASNGVAAVSNAYDHRHRRVRKATAAGTCLFAYDGWNLTAEVFVDSQTGATNVTRYLWGPDLSGTLQGAGGVGGLLAVIRSDGTFFPCYDANGNVTDYVDAYGTVRGHFGYDAFGNTVAMWGDLAHTFKFRFSTKYWDDETGLYYYGYRFYSPVLGRWISRDPIEEQGGINLLSFLNNNSLGRHDALGLTWAEVLVWFGEWVSGNGKTLKAFGPNSNASADMRNAPGVNRARAFFKQKNASANCCKDLVEVTNYKATFGLTGLFGAGLNSTQQFVGSYRVDILVWGCDKGKCRIDFELTNTTSFKSFFYGQGPSWYREEFKPLGNVTQTIWWTENYDAKCN